MRATVGIVATLGLLTLTASLFAQNTATVYSRNAVPGDLYTNPDNFSRGSNFGHPNWRYNNTRGGASVGIRNNYPRNGNGSVYLSSSSGAGKADKSISERQSQMPSGTSRLTRTIQLPFWEPSVNLPT